jgi:hypothetical protein
MPVSKIASSLKLFTLRQRAQVMSRSASVRARRAALSISGLGQSNVENLLPVPCVSIFGSSITEDCDIAKSPQKWRLPHKTP